VSSGYNISILCDLKRKVKISRLLRAFYNTEQTFVFKSFSTIINIDAFLNTSGRSGRSVMMCVCAEFLAGRVACICRPERLIQSRGKFGCSTRGDRVFMSSTRRLL